MRTSDPHPKRRRSNPKPKRGFESQCLSVDPSGDRLVAVHLEQWCRPRSPGPLEPVLFAPERRIGLRAGSGSGFHLEAAAIQ